MSGPESHPQTGETDALPVDPAPADPAAPPPAPPPPPSLAHPSPPVPIGQPTIVSATERTFKVLEDQLAEERTTKMRLEDRAQSVITSSGTLTTLLFALAALVTQVEGFTLAAGATWLLLAAVIAFLVAIAAALIASGPGTYQEVTEASLGAMAKADALGAPETDAAPSIANALVEIIKGARAGNKSKAESLRVAVVAELIAGVFVAIAVAVVLIDAAF